jgi:Arc/MetJ family transcription regulator
MRTTLDIDDDVLAATKELARRQRVSAGQVVSRLLRAALRGDSGRNDADNDRSDDNVAGFRPFRTGSRALVSNELIDTLRDQDGL